MKYILWSIVGIGHMWAMEIDILPKQAASLFPQNIFILIEQRRAGTRIPKPALLKNTVVRTRARGFDKSYIPLLRTTMKEIVSLQPDAAPFTCDRVPRFLTSAAVLFTMLDNTPYDSISNPNVLSFVMHLRYFDFSIQTESNGQHIKVPFLFYALSNFFNNIPKLTHILRYIQSVDVRDINGHTCLHIACKNPNIHEVLPLLMDHCAIRHFEHSVTLNTPNYYQDTPLHCAINNKNTDHAIIEYLIHNNANIHAKNCKGETPLHEAAYLLHPEHVQTLLEHGANCHEPNHAGITPFQLVQEFKKKTQGKTCVALMKAHRAGKRIKQMQSVDK